MSDLLVAGGTVAILLLAMVGVAAALWPSARPPASSLRDSRMALSEAALAARIEMIRITSDSRGRGGAPRS